MYLLVGWLVGWLVCVCFFSGSFYCYLSALGKKSVLSSFSHSYLRASSFIPHDILSHRCCIWFRSIESMRLMGFDVCALAPARITLLKSYVVYFKMCTFTPNVSLILSLSVELRTLEVINVNVYLYKQYGNKIRACSCAQRKKTAARFAHCDRMGIIVFLCVFFLVS